MNEFKKDIIYKGEQYRVENIYCEPVTSPGYYNLYIYKKCENDTYEKVCTWTNYKKEFDNYIDSTCRPGEKRLDIYEKFYIILIKEAFKRYEKCVELERMKQSRLEELENWDGVIE